MKSEVIIECSTVDTLLFFYLFANYSTNPDIFCLKPSAHQKFQLIRACRFGGVREQTNKQTHGHPIALEEGYISL